MNSIAGLFSPASVILFAAILFAPAASASDTVLLSNLASQPGDPSSAYISASIWDAAPFVTGDQAALLSSVTLPTLNLGGQGTFWVMVFSDNNGLPGLPIQNGSLSGPAHPSGQVTYYAMGEVRLAPNTKYWLVGMSNESDSSGRGYGWYMTFSSDYTGAAGWQLLQGGAFTSDAGANWNPTFTPFYFEIRGTLLNGAFPAVSIADATGTNSFVFAANLSRPGASQVSVDFKTVAAWANSNTFTPSSGTLTFPPGTTNQNIIVSLSGDSGTNQTFRLQLLNPTNAALANFEALGTLTNDYPLPEVLMLSGSVKEGNLHNPNLLALVKLARTSSVPVTVQFSTQGLAAIPGQDYTETNGTLTLGGGLPLVGWVPIQVHANILPEPDKTLTLQLSSPSNCVVSSTPGILTIVNDDGLPGMVDHFSIVTNAQALGGIPCPVTVTALDAAGQVVTNFSDRVFFMAGYSNSPPQHFGFEEGDFSQWSPLNGSSQPGPYELRQFDTTQPGVTNVAFRIAPNIGSDGIQRMLYLEGGQGYYISASFAQALDGPPNNGGSTARILIDNNQVAVASFGYMDYGQVFRTNVTFYYDSWYSYSRFFDLVFDRPFFQANAGVFADDVVVSPVQFQSVWSGLFTNGVWSGTVTFSGQGTDVLLFAEDIDTHRGNSSPMTVLPTPNLALGASIALGAARVGEPVTITISATNIGQAAASSVLVSNGFSPGVLIASATSTLGACANFGTNVLCTIPSLAAGQKATVTITARATDTNTCAFRAAISSDDPEPDLSNNSAQLSFSVGLPGLRSASITVHGAPGGTNLIFPVTLGGPFVQPVTVDYHTYAGVNPPPGDFIQTNGTLIFDPGVTSLSVIVRVLDDGVYQGTQGCALILDNPVNAVFLNGNFFDGTIIDNDAPPIVSINDVGVIEGDAGETNAVFTVSLTGATAIPATAQFATANGTALAGSDYFSTNGTLTFGPGTNSLPIIVRVRGDTVNEPDETFFVNLTSPVDATIARPRGTGTIINDDLVAGRVDHFVWAPVFSPQLPQRAIPVSVSALDAFGQLVTNFNGTVPLSAAAAGGAINLGLAPVVAGPFVSGLWSATVTFTNTGTQVVLQMDDGQQHVGSSNPFNVLARFPLALALPASATEGDGSLVNQCRVWFPQPETNDVIVPLTTTNLNLVTVPDSVLIAAGQTSAVFTITVLDDTLLNGTRTAWLSTVTTQYANATASMLIYDNETAGLAATLPAQITEGTASPAAGFGTVTVDRMPDTTITVLLTSSKPSRLQVPQSVTIPIGTNAATFSLNAPNNTLLDGNESITVTATVQNWTAGSAAILVKDNESYTLRLNAGNYIVVTEGMGTITNAVRVFLEGTTVSNLVVNLASTDTTELMVPSSVTIPAGTNGVSFNLTVVDDDETDGSQTVGLIASAPGFTNVTLNITVRDNDLHHYNFAALSGSYTSGVPFQVSITAADTNNQTLLTYSGLICFRALGSLGPFTIGITNVSGWLRGTWTGSLVIYSPYAQTVYLEALDLKGHSGRSTGIALALPGWAGSPRIRETHVTGADLVISFDTVAGTRYAVESASSPQGPWLSAGPEIMGTGAIGSLIAPNGAAFQARFYRLRLSRM